MALQGGKARGGPVVLCTILVLADVALSQPPRVEFSSGGVGLDVPLDTDLAVDGWGVNQFLGNGFLFDGAAARTRDSSGFARFARYQTSMAGQSSPAELPVNQDWAIEIGYKHTGSHSSINNPFLIKNFDDDSHILALFNDGGDSWSLGVGNAGGGYDMVASQLELGAGWNRFNFHYKASSQTIDAYRNNQLVAADLTVEHGQYNVDHVQLEYTGAGTDWFGDIKMGSAVPQTRSPAFGNDWVRSNPFTLQGLVLRRFSLDDPDRSDNEVLYRDANFTNVLAWENDVGLVDKAWEIHGLPWHWHTGVNSLNLTLQAQIHNWMANRPGGEGFLVWDEPNRPDFPAVREISDWIKQNYPETLVYGNLSTIHTPGSDYTQQYGSEPLPPPVPYNYETFVDDYVYEVQPDVLQFDIYPITDAPQQPVADYLRDRYFHGMETIRKAGVKADIPYFVVVQTFDGGGTRLPSESETRFQTFAALAYGFKGITYFTYDHFGAFGDGADGGMLRALDPQEQTYTTNPVYFHVKDINPELSHLGETLKMMESTQVRYILGKHLENSAEVPNEVPLGVSLWNPAVDEPYITSIEASHSGTIPDITQGDLLLGHFETAVEDLDGAQFEDELYFMLVNLLMDETEVATQNIHIEFDFGATGISSLQRLNRLTGDVEVVPLVHESGSLYHVDLTLAGGTGDLFKYNTGAPFIGVARIAGDYNGDGFVDAADYTFWRDELGQNVTPGTGADGDSDGVIGGGDYNVWKTNFGLGPASGSSSDAAVPEPWSLSLAAIAWLAALFCRAEPISNAGRI